MKAKRSRSDCPECGGSFQFDSLVVRIRGVLEHKSCFNKVTPHERRWLVDSIGYYGKSPRVGTMRR